MAHGGGPGAGLPLVWLLALTIVDLILMYAMQWVTNYDWGHPFYLCVFILIFQNMGVEQLKIKRGYLKLVEHPLRFYLDRVLVNTKLAI